MWVGSCSKEGYITRRISLLDNYNVLAVRDSGLRLEELWKSRDTPGQTYREVRRKYRYVLFGSTVTCRWEVPLRAVREGTSPYVQQTFPYVWRTLPYAQRTFPYVQRMVPYVQRTFPYVQRTLPYVQQTSPYVQRT